VDDLWVTNREDVGLIVRTISFQDFQPMWSWSTNVTDRQTDGQMTCKTVLCTVVVHRAVKMASCFYWLNYSFICIRHYWLRYAWRLHARLCHRFV